MSDLEPADRHLCRCAVWLSDLPCDCGVEDLADDMPVWQPPTMPLLVAEPGSLANHLNHIEATS